VIRAARKHLASLEASSMQTTPQFDLFADPGMAAVLADEEAFAQPSAIEDALANINPDALSPRDALDALYRLKELSNQHKE